MRHYYALSDSSTSPNPAEPASGFANSCEAIAFKSWGARAAWLAATKLLKARAITLPEAIKLTPSYINGLKVVSVHDIDATGRAVDTGGVVTLRKSIYLQDYSM